MGSGSAHHHVFFVHADSGVHRLAPECKLVATVLFVFAVVATRARPSGRSPWMPRSWSASPWPGGCPWESWPGAW